MSNPLNTQNFSDQHRRSVDYLVKGMHEHHIQLSHMADQKGQTLLGISALIVTFVINQLVSDNFSWGLIILATTVFAAMVAAILALRPSLGPKGESVPASTPIPRIKNPLFFGSFANLEGELFLEEMNYVIEDSDKLYEALFMTVYNNGKVMADKKYRLITLSYNLFLTGMILGTTVAVIEFLVQM